jgi:hypothetical protein
VCKCGAVFTHLLRNGPLRVPRQILRRLLDDGNYDVPKHVDLLTSNVHVSVHVMLVI